MGDEASPDEPMTLLNVGFALKESSGKANSASAQRQTHKIPHCKRLGDPGAGAVAPG